MHSLPNFWRRPIHALHTARIDLRPRDRRLLEDVILPSYAQRPPMTVLFVGTRAGNRHYEALFAGHCYLSVDRDPRMARHGSTQGHAVACVSEIDAHLVAASLDLCILNGVIGWGLNDPALADRALLGLHRLLRPGGELLIGWNDRPGRRPFELAALPALAGFERRVFAPLDNAVVNVPGWRRHRYEFFARR